MNERNRNIDVLRACATLLVVVYHSWVLSGSASVFPSLLQPWIKLGGEIAVTTFFMLSGFGIFLSLSRQHKRGERIRYFPFLKKRISRVAPPYYFCLAVCLLLTDSAMYFSKSGMINVAQHLLFIHNLSPNSHGAINGALWTMGVTVQFYLLAVPLFHAVRKHPFLTVVCAVAFTVTAKWYVFSTVAPGMDVQSEDVNYVYFFLGRQLPTALDNFVLGMVCAQLLESPKLKLKKWQGWLFTLFSLAAATALLLSGQRYGIHANTLSGYTWHSLLSMDIVVLMIGVSNIRLDYIGCVHRFFLWISGHEYGIYLWHLPMINKLPAKLAPVRYWVRSGKHLYVIVLFTVLSVAFGALMDVAAEPLTEQFVKLTDKTDDRIRGLCKRIY